MTVNERLSAAGLLDEFDKVAYAQDEDGITAILAKVDLGNESASEVIAWIKSSPHSPYIKPKTC